MIEDVTHCEWVVKFQIGNSIFRSRGRSRKAARKVMVIFLILYKVGLKARWVSKYLPIYLKTNPRHPASTKPYCCGGQEEITFK